LLRRSAACLAATQVGGFGITGPGNEARGGGDAELDEFAELAVMMSAATRDLRLPFLRNQASDSFFFSPPSSSSARPPDLSPRHPALSPAAPSVAGAASVAAVGGTAANGISAAAFATRASASGEESWGGRGGGGEGGQMPHENLLGNFLLDDYINKAAALHGRRIPRRVISDTSASASSSHAHRTGAPIISHSLPRNTLSDPENMDSLKRRLLGSRGKGHDQGEEGGRGVEGGDVRGKREGKGDEGGEEWAVVDAVQLPPPPSDAEAVEHWARAMIIDVTRGGGEGQGCDARRWHGGV
ncbi:hypothetical protein CLOP_g5656, partial [Closterium sp. NIES-67]